MLQFYNLQLLLLLHKVYCNIQSWVRGS